ncbi:MAG: PAS domain S-box protein [Dehalococcoidales bacterium]|nr:PAS domain S-box protein [Dehalococcoidales bacterium]
MSKDSRAKEITQSPIHSAQKHKSANKYEISSEWYRTMVKGSEEGFLLFESNGAIIDVNESLCSMLGYSREEMLSTTVLDYDFGLNNNCEKLSKMVDQLKQLGGIHHFESQLKCKIGIIIDVIGSIQYLDIESGLIFCFFHDVTEHKMLERKLEESERKYRELFDDAPIAYIYVDFNGFIRDSNKEARKLLGYTHDELTGIKIYDLHPDELKDEGMLIFKQATQGKIIQDKEVIHISKDGYKIYCLLSINPLKNAEGKTIALRSTLKDITLRKYIEQQLEESKEFSDNIIRSMKDGFSTVNDKGVQLDVNDAFCLMTGYSYDELVGKQAPFPYWPEEEYRSIQEAFQKTLKSEFDDFELVFKRKNGERFPVIVSPYYMKRPRGEITYFMATVKDITERKKMEKQLQESKEFSEKVVRVMKDGFSMFNSEGILLNVNEALCRMTGFEYNELVGQKRPFPYWAEEEYDSINAAFQKVLAGESSDFELVYKRKNGERFPVLVSPYSMIDAGGKFRYFMATIKDITERKKMTEAVRLEAERLKSLAEIVQYESESIQQLLDFTLEEAIKLTKSKFGYINFYDEDKKEFTFNTWSKETMKECNIIDTPMVFHLENTGIWGEVVRQSKPIIVNDFQANNPLKKGYPVGHAEIHKYLTIPVFFQNRIVAVIAVANKETDYNESDTQQLILLMDSVWKAVLRKRAEEELKNQLQKKMEYTRALVHELKTPLTSLQIASDILCEIATASPYLDVSNNISRSVKQLSKRADELLDIARGEIGLLNLRYRKVNLEAFCAGIKEELIPIASKKGISLECNKDIDIASVKMDDERILQVIYNLFDNALKFTPRGGKIVMSITTDKDNIFISVKDNGCGISKEKMENLFNPRKTSPENNQRFSGLGVGLILSKMLIELHGGNLRVESEMHKGSTFMFSLPLHVHKQVESQS